MDEESRALTCTLSSFNDYALTARFNIIKVREQKLERLKRQQQQLDSSISSGSTEVKSPNYYELARNIIEPQLNTIADCIENNDFFLSSVVSVSSEAFGAPTDTSTWEESTMSEISKVVSLLAQISREWSVEGIPERDGSMGRVIGEIESLFPELEKGSQEFENHLSQMNKKLEDLTEEELNRLTRDRSTVKIVIPGCGLGRLPLELAARGFFAQGNEVSFAMLFTSNFLLNHTEATNEYRLNPWIHSFSHIRHRDYQSRAIYVPDVHPAEFLTRRMKAFGKPAGELSMIAGSFEDVYPSKLADATSLDLSRNQTDRDASNPKAVDTSEKGSDFEKADTISSADEDTESPSRPNPKAEPVGDTIIHADVIATVFFIDTSPNIFKTLDVISKTLVKGGYWVNFGPLLWHYEHSIPSMEVSNSSRGTSSGSLDKLGADSPNEDIEHNHSHGHHIHSEMPAVNSNGDDEDRSAGLEISVNDILNLLPEYGLKLLKYDTNIPTSYAVDSMSMRGDSYNCEYWVVVKS